MRRCGFTYSSAYECHKRAPFGVCLRHFLGRFRYQFGAGRQSPVSLTVDLDNMNRPYFMYDEDHLLLRRFPRWAALSWGNTYGDPVWCVNVQVPDSPPKGAWLGLALAGTLAAMAGHRKRTALEVRPPRPCPRRDR